MKGYSSFQTGWFLKLFMGNSPGKTEIRHSFSLKKAERLCSKKQIEKLFSDGNSFLVYPLRVIHSGYDFPEPYPAKAAFAVSKKLFKKSVQRNLIKRRMREAYRLNKHILQAGTPAQQAIIFIFIGKGITPFHVIEKAMQKSLYRIKNSTMNP